MINMLITEVEGILIRPVNSIDLPGFNLHYCFSQLLQLFLILSNSQPIQKMSMYGKDVGMVRQQENYYPDPPTYNNTTKTTKVEEYRDDVG